MPRDKWLEEILGGGSSSTNGEGRKMSKEELASVKLAESTLDQYITAMRHVEGGSAQDEAIQEFFGDDKYENISNNGFHPYSHYKLQWVQSQYFEKLGMKLVKECDFGFGFIGEQPPEMIDIEHEPDKVFKGYKQGTVFYASEKKDHKVVVSIRESYSSSGYTYQVYHSTGNDNLLKDWIDLADEKNFYKGKKIDASCRFLELTNYSWGDVVLPNQTLDIIKNNVLGLFEHAETFRKFGISMKRGLILHGPPGTGKAQPLSSLVATPSGWKAMDDIQPGDEVCTPNGTITKVIDTYPQGDLPIYKITFADGDSVECCGDHLWEISSKNRKTPFITDTRWIKKHYLSPSGYRMLSIRCPDPVVFNKREVPVDPYMLGILLGDGNLTNGSVAFSSADTEIVNTLMKTLEKEYTIKTNHHTGIDHRIVRTKRSPKPTKYTTALRNLGLWDKDSFEKFVPEIYLKNDIETRKLVLRGLMDSDGYVNSKTGMPEITICSKMLSEGVKDLVESLGGVCVVKEKKNVSGNICYRCFIKYDDAPDLFMISRKKTAARKRTKYPVKRVISSVEVIGRKPCKCILVEDSNHLYLTNNYVVTHNTQICKAIANEAEASVLYVLPSDFQNERGGVRRITQMAKDLAPCILIIEDMDWIAKNRHASMMAGFTMELMNQLDGLEEFGEIVTIGTTNALEDLENAVKNRPGRFDRVIEVPHPEQEQRESMIKLFTSNFTLRDVNVEKVAETFDGLSGAHVRDICQTAAHFAVRDGSIENNGEELILTEKHFKKAWKEVKDKDYSSYQETQSTEGKKSNFGFQTRRPMDYLDEDDDLL